MTSDRKHPSVALWITVALVAVLLYVLSTGPAEWAAENGWIPPSLLRIVSALYTPIQLACTAFPDSVGKAFDWYLDFWI